MSNQRLDSRAQRDRVSQSVSHKLIFCVAFFGRFDERALRFQTLGERAAGRVRGEDRKVKTEEVGLAQVDAVVAQDRVRRRRVEVEVRHRVAQQIVDAREAALTGAAGDDDLARRCRLHRLRRDGANEGEGLVDAGLQLSEGLLVVGVLRDIDAGEARAAALGVFGREHNFIGLRPMKSWILRTPKGAN